MDEPFSALDIQTRQLMENEVLELWAAKKKAVLFITHDLDEAIAMSDRVVVLSAGPASHPIGEFAIDLARPRDVAEVRTQPRFIELHRPSGTCCAKRCSRATGSSWPPDASTPAGAAMRQGLRRAVSPPCAA